jgi:hypothetical protein
MTTTIFYIYSTNNQKLSYKNCKLNKFLENFEEAKGFRNNLKVSLLKRDHFFKFKSIKKFHRWVGSCASQFHLLDLLVWIHSVYKSTTDLMRFLPSFLTDRGNELPSDFYAAFITSMKILGYLRFASVPMYYAFSKVERLLQLHF